LGFDCVVQTALYIFCKPFYISYKPHYFSYKPGRIFYKPNHISHELVYISFHKIAYISIYDDPKPVYMSAEVMHCDIEKQNKNSTIFMLATHAFL